MVNPFVLFWEYLKLSLNSFFEYKINAVVQIVTMIINDIFWILLWWILFDRFTTIGGWAMNDMLLLYAIVAIGYGLAFIFFGNANEIARKVNRGELDFYLTIPAPVLWHFLVTRSSMYAAGDLIFGLIIACLFIDKIALILVLSIIVSIIFTAFAILVNSLAFYIGQAEETSRHLFFGLITLASYPFGVFQGVAKFILLFLIPAGFVSGIPIALLQEFQFPLFAGLVTFTLVLTALATFVFYRGLRRYESGNMLTIRL